MTAKKPIGALPLDIAQRLRDDIDAVFDEFDAELVRIYRFDIRAYEELERQMRATKGATLTPLKRRLKELAERMFPAEHAAGDACFVDEQDFLRNPDGTRLLGPRVLQLTDFIAVAPEGKFMHVATRGFWPAKPIDDAFPRIIVNPDSPPRQWRTVTASEWLNRNRRVEQITWIPGEPNIIENRLLAEGGWIDHPGVRVFNMYRAPTLMPKQGDPAPWIDHVESLYGKDVADHIIWFLAAVMQGYKVNHMLILGGAQGIGKDTILAPVVAYLGSWNVSNIDPADLLGTFNAFLKSQLLRISEARELTDGNRYTVYAKLKPITTTPPETLMINDKHIRAYRIPNAVNIVIGTNEAEGAIYTPGDDRRSYVAWSDIGRDDKHPPQYFKGLYEWFENEDGYAIVADFLLNLDISDMDVKADPPRTTAWHLFHAACQPSGTVELANAILNLGTPKAVTLGMLATADNGFYHWQSNNRTAIAHRLREAGYMRVPNTGDKQGLWTIGGRKQAVYALSDLVPAARQDAVAALIQAAREAAAKVAKAKE